MSFRQRGFLPLIGIAIFAVILVACDGSQDPTLSKPFKSAPWTGAETLTYNLVEQDGRVAGTCELKTTPEVEPAKTELDRLCSRTGGQYHDNGTVVVDSNTLQPSRSERTITDDANGKKTTISVVYDGSGGVRIERNDDGKIRSVTRELPRPSSQSPDPGGYDDGAVYWLARGLPLQTGFSATFADTNPGVAQVVTVTIKVAAKERIHVPAGDFNTWRIRIDTSSTSEAIWIDDAPPHRMVRATAEQFRYELTSIN